MVKKAQTETESDRAASTRVRDQPALTSSRGTEWVIVGGLLGSVLTAILLLQGTVLGLWGSALTVVLFLGMAAVRVSIPVRRRRLRVLAVLVGMMAAAGLVFLLVIRMVDVR